MFPRVLVISNNCFSKSDSNGRTLGNFFIGWPKENLAQFYLQSAEPDFSYCNRYYRVTDSQAMSSLFGKSAGGVVKPSENSENSLTLSSNPLKKGRKKKRNALTMLLREAVWGLGFWKTKRFKNWLDEINPEVVLLQAGDCAFMFKLAVKISKSFNAKLVIYNTEGYYFKNFDYFQAKGLAHLFYPIFRSNLKRAIKKAYKRSDYSIFNCNSLRDDFCKEFNLKSDVIYTATDFVKAEPKPKTEGFTVTYAGNFGVGRAHSLVEVANALQKIDENLFVDLYGAMPDEGTKKLFDDCKGIRYHGKISYDEVKARLADSDLLLHVESFDEYFIKDSKYAFSTKIADSLASNRCFLIYAPSEFAATRYLLENEAAYVATDDSSLQSALATLVSDVESRQKYLDNAQRLVEKNHNKSASVDKFQNILCNL